MSEEPPPARMERQTSPPPTINFRVATGRGSNRRNVLNFFGYDPNETASGITKIYNKIRTNDRGLSERQVSVLLNIMDTIRAEAQMRRTKANMAVEDFERLWNAISGFK